MIVFTTPYWQLATCSYIIMKFIEKIFNENSGLLFYVLKIQLFCLVLATRELISISGTDRRPENPGGPSQLLHWINPN